jgi:hypothetical protein
MRIAIVLLLAINVILYSANSGLWGVPLTAGLHNPAPLASQLNPTAMQVRPLAPGEGDGHPVVGPPVPDIKVMQTDLSGSAAGPQPDGVTSAVSGASAPIASASLASGASAPVASPAQGGSSAAGVQAATGGASAALVASSSAAASAAQAAMAASATAAPTTAAPTTKATGSAQKTPSGAPKS